MKIIEKLAARCNDARAQAPALIAFLGDSVTHGCFEVFMNRFGHVDTVYRPEDGYEKMLRDRLNLYFPAAAVNTLNAGISGDNAAGGLNRIERDVLRFSPDLVVVNFALNDSMSGMTKLEDYLAAMRGIFAKVLASGAECILLTPNAMCSYVSPALPEGRLREIAQDACKIQNDGVLTAYVDAARRLAAEMHVPVADAYAVWQKLIASGADTTALLINHINHPCKEMHKVFANVLEETILS